jgi:hypothetical protein
MNNINFLILIFLIIIIFYLTFKNLVNLIEKKFNHLKIESPKVNVQLPSNFINEEIKNEKLKFIIESKKYDSSDGEEIKNFEFDNSFKENSDFLLEGFDSYENKNENYENKQKSSHICFDDHKHTKCNLGVMNYPDPKDLSPIDYDLFKLNYPPNMTMQDYVNWLYCFKDSEEQLTYVHLKNLYKLKKNEPLKEVKGVCPPPGYESSPLEAQKYFDNLYNVNNEFKIASHLNSQTGPIIAYNNEDYGEFYQHQDTYGTSSYLRNCDIGMKKNANELSELLVPKDSNNLEIYEKYKKFYKKNVEI